MQKLGEWASSLSDEELKSVVLDLSGRLELDDIELAQFIAAQDELERRSIAHGKPVERTPDCGDIMPPWKPDLPVVDRSCDGGTTD